MSGNPILLEYESRLQELHSNFAEVRGQHAGAALVLLIASAVFLLLVFNTFKQRIPGWWTLVPIPIAAASLNRYRRYRDEQSRIWRLQCFYDSAVERVKGNWQGCGVNGDEFAVDDHAYARDLNILGDGSLFELLCIARTAIGRKGLADHLLLKAPSIDETVARQDAIRELSGMRSLREQVAVLGAYEALESKWETFAEWLDLPPVESPKLLRVGAAITSSCIVGIALVGATGQLPWTDVGNLILPFAMFQGMVGLIFKDRVNRVVNSVRTLSIETQVLREGLGLLEATKFQSPKMLRIAEQVRNGAKTVRNLERLLDILAERNKDWFYPLSLILLGGTQLCMAIEQWRKQHGTELRSWLEAWAEFEALNALSNYAHENPANTFPEFSAGTASVQAIALGHPLLPDEGCIRNDVRLDSDARFYVISGSNMSGKSTLLRTIGLNAVLAFAGAPVRAERLRLSRLSVYASLAVVDSLLNGKSKFLAEVERLRQAIESALRQEPVLFLIDEIFSGTNSRDRRVAAEAVVRTLVTQGAVGALSTHDMSLTEIVDSDGLRGANVHMGARDPSDPLSFDYILKPGITNETNALAIARMVGVPV